MITRPKVTLNKLNSSALQQCRFSSSSNKSFGDLSKLKDYTKRDPDFETLALNDFELDGDYSDDLINVAFMSTNLSNQNCAFSSSTAVRMRFTSPQTLPTVTLHFGKNYPKKIRIDGYSSGSLSVTETIDNISSETIYSSVSFTGVTSIRVTFLETWTPYRYANLQYFLPGGFIEFSGDRISSLTLNESTDVISSKLEVDTAHLEVFRQNKEFNILDYNNIIKMLKKGDSADIEVEVEENGSTNTIILGRYYIDKISTTSDELLSLDFITLLGLMDNVNYIHSGMAIDDQEPLENINAKRVIDSIFYTFLTGIGVPQSEHYKYYEVESEIEQIRTYGYIPKMSCREALQNVCFVYSLVVYDNRSSKIRIKKYKDYSPSDVLPDSQIIPKKRSLTNPEIVIQDKINSISAQYNKITLDSSETTILTVYAEGTYIFDSPVEVTRVDVTTPGVTISYVKRINYIKITIVTGFRRFTANIIGKKYKINQQTIVEEHPNEAIKTITISNSRMLTDNNIEEFILGLYDYYSENNVKATFEYINTTQETGEVTDAIFEGKRIRGYLIHQDLDVSGGMVARAEILARF